MKQALFLPLLGLPPWSALYYKHQLAALMWTVPMGALAHIQFLTDHSAVYGPSGPRDPGIGACILTSSPVGVTGTEQLCWDSGLAVGRQALLTCRLTSLLSPLEPQLDTRASLSRLAPCRVFDGISALPYWLHTLQSPPVTEPQAGPDLHTSSHMAFRHAVTFWWPVDSIPVTSTWKQLPGLGACCLPPTSVSVVSQSLKV